MTQAPGLLIPLERNDRVLLPVAGTADDDPVALDADIPIVAVAKGETADAGYQQAVVLLGVVSDTIPLEANQQQILKDDAVTLARRTCGAAAFGSVARDARRVQIVRPVRPAVRSQPIPTPRPKSA